MAEVSASGAFTTRSWTRQDYILTVIAVLVKMGDGVELYLPGVITQKVSCELGVSSFQEGILAIAMYLCYALAVIFAVPVSKAFGEKLTLFLSLYLSITFAVLCAVVPNYYTLLLSRALTGLCAGLNGNTIGVYVAKHVSSKEVHKQSTFLFEGFAITIGGTWVSFLGWLILDLIGWRVFVVITSIPLFVPPILVLHFCISEVIPEEGNSDEEVIVARNETENVPNFAMRLTKSSLFFFCSICVGYGSIILLPWLMRSYKEELGVDEDTCSDHVVHGNDLLILSAVTGATNVIGRPIGFFLWKRVRFFPLQLTITAVMALCYALILIIDNLIASEILIAVAKFCFSLQAVELAELHFDYEYFGMARFDLGSSVTNASGMLGSIMGTALAAFLSPHIAIAATLAIVCVEIVVVCLMKERF